MARQRIDLSSTVSIFKQSFSSCSSNLLPFFFVSLLLFSFRLSLERGTVILSSFLDQQSSVQSLFPSSPSSSNNSPDTSSSSSSSQPYSPSSSSGDPPEDAVSRKAAGARRAFVIFTRGGTLDDDFLADEPSSYSRRRRHYHSSSGMGFPWDSSVSLNVTPFLMRSIPAAQLRFPDEVGGEEEREIHAIVESSSLLLVSDQVSGRNEVNRTRVELLGQKDAAVLAMLLIGMSAAFGWLLLGFLFLHSFSCGIVFFSVANAYLGKNVSVMRALSDAFKYGIHRLTVFVLFRWALREVLTQFLSLCFFSAMKDEYALIRLVVRLKLVPFSVTLPMANEISLPFSNEISNGGGPEVSMKILGFLLSWYMVDMFISFLHNIDCWVALTDSRPSVLDAVREGCCLTCMMWSETVCIKFWESLFCGLCVRWVVAKLGGDNFSSFFQSLAETYFLVVWLVFYFAAKSKATAGQWGHRELEGCLDSLR